MMGSLSKREEVELFRRKVDDSEYIQEAQESDLDENMEWDPEIDVPREKSFLLNILGKLVPQSEIFLTSA